MSTVKSKKLQVGTDARATNNFTIYQPSTPDGTLRIGVGNADSPTEVGRFDSNGYVATTAPAFRARKTSDQSISSSTWTKVTFDTEDFDTNSNFASSRFTPTVAGYYQISIQIRFEGTNHDNRLGAVYKNGSLDDILFIDRGSIASANVILNGSTIVYCNGSTDYLEVYGSVSATSPKFGFSSIYNTCVVSGFLARAA